MEFFINPGNRTATGIDQMTMRSLAKMQRMEQGLQNSIMDIMRLTIDPWCPMTVRRQVRFPRSKKRRIRKKWAKDQRNWKDVRVAFRIVDPKGWKFSNGDFTPLPGFEKSSAIVYE
jgi:hypothetical protein